MKHARMHPDSGVNQLARAAWSRVARWLGMDPHGPTLSRRVRRGIRHNIKRDTPRPVNPPGAKLLRAAVRADVGARVTYAGAAEFCRRDPRPTYREKDAATTTRLRENAGRSSYA